jgi:hypothetical protein
VRLGARAPRLPITSQSSPERICLSWLPTGLEAFRPRTYLSASPHHSIGPRRDGIHHPLSITYAFRPRLRPASPAVDQHRCGTLGHPVGRILTPLALLVPTFALPSAPAHLPVHLLCCWGRSPTMSVNIRGFGGMLSPGGLSVPRHVRPVSYYALFQGWLLLSQPPGCLRAATPLPT